MRKELEKLVGQRMRFRGTFDRFSEKRGYMGPEKKLVLQSVCLEDTGEEVTDHLWFNLTKGFEALNLKHGDVVAFDARCQPYEKGYKGRRWEVQIERPIERDYHLTHPTKIEIVERAPQGQSE